jgi:hypothetical protein
MDTLYEKNSNRTVCDKLRQILRLADFVKFAKLHPLPDENNLSLSNAYEFVNQTKPEEIPAPATDTSVPNEEAAADPLTQRKGGDQ